MQTADNQVNDAKSSDPSQKPRFIKYGLNHVTQLIEEKKGGKISVDTMKQIQGDTHLLVCDDFLPILKAAAKASVAPLDTTESAAAVLLESWDCSSPSGYTYDPETATLAAASDAAEISRSAASSIFHAWDSCRLIAFQ
jgi:hypothetical protein